MGKYRTSLSDIVRYTLRDSLGNLKISEPIGWEEDEKEFKRSTDVHGVFINLSNNLEFPRGDEYNNGGYDRLRQIYDLEGINAVVLLIKEEKFNGVWEESYRGYLDFSTFSRQNNIAKIKFNESGLYEKIKARQSESIELERETTLDGDTIEPLTTETVELKGRDILIIDLLSKTTSKFEQEIPSGDNKVTLIEDANFMALNHNNGGKWEAICVPISQATPKDGNVASVTEYNIRENEDSYHDGETTGTMFYDSNNDITLNIGDEFNSIGGINVCSKYYTLTWTQIISISALSIITVAGTMLKLTHDKQSNPTFTNGLIVKGITSAIVILVGIMFYNETYTWKTWLGIATISMGLYLLS